MKPLIGVLYLLTGFVGLYWSVRLTLTGLYAVPFSPWYVVVCIGAVMLLAAAVLSWVSMSLWSQWVPVIGSLLLASYFVPATVGMLRSYLRSEVTGGTQLGIRLAAVGLVLASLVSAIVSKVGHIGNRPLR